MVNVQNKPKVTVNGVQETYHEQSLGRQLLELAQVLGEITIFLVMLIYRIGESIYRTIVPIEPKSVKGEIVLITGTGHGIGKELALLYASQGATVVGWDINDENGKQTAKEINESGYPKSYSYICDVGSRANVMEVAKKVKEEVGDVTILINNAGIMPSHRLLEHTEEEIERIYKINVFAHCWTLQAFLPSMIEKNHGHIVALSSCAGLFGLENLVPYCGSKFAVRGIMEALSEELRIEYKNSNIEFTVICPYMVNTGLCKKPRVRFESLMPLLDAKYVSQSINMAQRMNMRVVSVPKYLQYLGNYVRLLPLNAAMQFKDMMNSGVESDL